MKGNEVELIKKVLEKYIYSFEQPKVYTNSYFKEVISKIYGESSLNKNFTLFLTDADKLGKINREQGEAFGDIALKNTLQMIVDNMPSNMIFSRIGGDEFVGIIEGFSKEDVEKIAEGINEKIGQNNSEKLMVKMTFGITDSNESEKFAEMLRMADNRVLQKKGTSKDIKKLNNEDIRENIEENILNFYEYFRLGNNNNLDTKKMQQYKDYIKELYNEIIVSDEIENKTSISQNLIEEIEIKNNSTDEFSLDEAILIQKHISEVDFINSLVKEDREFARDILKKVFYKMLYNVNTNQFNKLYYDTILEKKFNSQMKTQNYHVVFCHTTGLKISNTLIGYKETDNELYKVGTQIEDSFNKDSNFSFFNKRPLSFNSNSSYIFDMNAGDFLLVIPEEKISSEKIEEKLTELYNVFDHKLLQVLCLKKNTKDFDNMYQCISELKFETYLNKNNKFNKVDQTIVNKLIERCLWDSIEFYKKDEEKFKDPKLQQDFIDIFVSKFEDAYTYRYVKDNERNLDEK